MNTYINKFIIRLFIFSIALAAISYGLIFVLPEKNISPVLFLLFPFFFSATVIVFNYLVKSAEKKFNTFVNRFILATFIKLMLYLAVLLTYIFTHKNDAIPFTLSFFILYVAYTFFEVIEMLKFNRAEKK